MVAPPDGRLRGRDVPEISVPPHTQRQVIRRLRDQSTQCLVTSHSPYVAEGFVPDGLTVLRRGPDHELIGSPVVPGAHVKRKSLIRDFRTRFAEGLLGRAVLAVEGVSERLAVPIVAEKLAAADGVLPLDALGVTVIDATGEGGQGEIGRFFQSLGLPTYVFADTSKNPRVREQIQGAFGGVAENPCKSLEEFLTTTLPVARLREFVRVAQGWDTYPDIPRLSATANDDEVRSHVRQVLTARKGEGYAAELLAICQASEIPEPLAGLVRRIHRELSPTPSTAVRSSP